jgi:hypothetical protein
LRSVELVEGLVDYGAIAHGTLWVGFRSLKDGKGERQFGPRYSATSKISESQSKVEVKGR